jgi:hypothetical protein
MRKMAFAVLMVSAVAGGFMGCGGSTPQKVSGAGGTTGGTAGSGAGSTGAAGTSTTGSAGTTGTAGDGTGTAGSTAGTTGTAGAGGATAGTTGAAGVAGTAGDSGAAGTTAPAPAYCDTHTKKTLPYNIGGDFTSIQTLTHASQTWKQIGNPDCDQTVFPPLNPSDGGTDGGADGGADAALALNDDAAADAPVDAPVDGGSVDAPADVVTNPIPACFEFTYNPDPCVAATGLSATAALGTCYAGTIFQPAGNLLGAADQGICIGDGATQVTFQARANVNGQIIKFGSTREGLNQTEFYITLSTTWTTYHTAIPAGEPYNMSSNLGGVWNGFSVVGEPQSNVGGTYILIRNITWSQ